MGLPRFAWASLTLVSCLDGGNWWPWTSAGGVICLKCGFRSNTVRGGTTLCILAMLAELIRILLLITVWLMLVTREMYLVCGPQL